MRSSSKFISLARLLAISVSAACNNTPACGATLSENLAPDVVELVTSVGEIEFQPVPGLVGVETALLFGNPDEAGPYAIRVRVAEGVLTPPHFHDQDRQITVIEGDWAFGLGSIRTCDDSLTVEAGGVAFHPAGVVHFDGSCGGSVVVQINGVGPVNTTLVADAQ